MLGHKVKIHTEKVTHPMEASKREPSPDDAKKKVPKDYERIRNIVKDSRTIKK